MLETQFMLKWFHAFAIYIYIYIFFFFFLIVLQRNWKYFKYYYFLYHNIKFNFFSCKTFPSLDIVSLPCYISSSHSNENIVWKWNNTTQNITFVITTCLIVSYRQTDNNNIKPKPLKTNGLWSFFVHSVCKFSSPLARVPDMNSQEWNPLNP